MKRLALRLALLSVLVAAVPAAGLAIASRRPAARLAAPALPEVSADHPLVVLVRGWLWEPASREGSPRLEVFPNSLNRLLGSEHGIAADVVEYEWSRIPVDLFRAGWAFEEWAEAVAGRAGEDGRCVAFVGHSAGAAIVYNAAAQGVRMGYLGTLGLPSAGRQRPSSVGVWANFYTTTHGKDFAGSIWGGRIRSDLNVDLAVPHSRFWQQEATARVTADGIARTWRGCGEGAQDV